MYAKLENEKWIEVQGNGVAKHILQRLGFVPLMKYDGELQANQIIVIEYDGFVCSEVVITKEWYVKFGQNEPQAISDKAKDFLERHFASSKNEDVTGATRKTRYRLGNAELKGMRKLVWERWSEFVADYVSKKFATDEDNDESGISLADLTLLAFFGDDWPVQAKSGKKPLSKAAIDKIKLDTKAVLKAKRDAVEASCIPTQNTPAHLLGCLEATASWVMDEQV
jgi:hypothetical protein